jgi:hypothetical protein
VPIKWVFKNKLKVMKNKGNNVCLDPVLKE